MDPPPPQDLRPELGVKIRCFLLVFDIKRYSAVDLGRLRWNHLIAHDSKWIFGLILNYLCNKGNNTKPVCMLQAFISLEDGLYTSQPKTVYKSCLWWHQLLVLKFLLRLLELSRSINLPITHTKAYPVFLHSIYNKNHVIFEKKKVKTRNWNHKFTWKVLTEVT